MKRTITAGIATAAIMVGAMTTFAATSADAATSFSNITVSGKWTAVTPNSVSGVGTNKISWGKPKHKNGKQSSYVFNGNAPTGPQNADNVFNIGKFTHNNFVITKPHTWLTNAKLTVQVSGTVNPMVGASKEFNISSVFGFRHLETPNEKPCSPSGSTICPDVVSFINNLSSAKTVKVGDTEFTLAMTGFRVNTKNVARFVTEENKRNMAQITASFKEMKDVPEIDAAAGMGSIAGLGAMLAFYRGRRRHTTA